MAKLVPNTQTGSLTDHQHGTNDTLILGAGTAAPRTRKSPCLATPSPCTTTAAAAMTR